MIIGHRGVSERAGAKVLRMMMMMMMMLVVLLLVMSASHRLLLLLLPLLCPCLLADNVISIYCSGIAVSESSGGGGGGKVKDNPRR